MRRRVAGCVLVAALLLAAGCSHSGARAAARQELGPGKFLVASRDLRDPNFAETVILLAQYDETAAMGLVINKPTRVPIAQLFPEMELAQKRRDRAYLGGPVLITGVLALLRSNKRPGNSQEVLEDIYLISSGVDLDQAIRDNQPPERFRVYMGYAGWGPRQLESEMALGSWHVFDGEADLVFDPRPDTVWDRLIRRTERVFVLNFGWRLPTAPEVAAP